MIPFLGAWACDQQRTDILTASISLLSATEILAIQASWLDDDKEPDYAVDAGVATIALKGPLTKDGGWWTRYMGGTSSTSFAEAIDAASSDPSVKAILIDCDCPGGEVLGTPAAAEAVARCQKPVLAYVSGMCCSGAYWICSQADGIYGRPESQSGNIGCYTYLTDTSEMYKRIGIKVEVFRSGDHKAVGIAGTKITDAQRTEIQKRIDGIADLFRAAVASGRRMKPEKVSAVSDGRSFLGAQAVSEGLLDGVAGHDAVMCALQNHVPGSKNKIRVEARQDPEGTSMRKPNEIWDELSASMKGFLGGAQAATDTRTAPSGGSSVTSDPEKAQLEANLQRITKERDEAMASVAAHDAALQSARATENRNAVMALVTAGKVKPGEVDAECALRAKSPEVYDATMSRAVASVLTPTTDKISGEEASDKAAAANATAEQKFLDAAAAHVKATYGLQETK